MDDSRLSIIVDLMSTSFDFKSVYSEVFPGSTEDTDHHYWYYAGLRSFTINLGKDHDEKSIEKILERFKLLQNSLSGQKHFWISWKKRSIETPDLNSTTSTEVIRRNRPLARFSAEEDLQLDYNGGALTKLNLYVYDIETEIKNISTISFFNDKIELDFDESEKKFKKIFKSDMMEKCIVLTKTSTTLTVFLNMTGNAIDHQLKLSTTDSTTKISSTRISADQSQPFYSTVRISLSISNAEENSSTKSNFERCSQCFTEFFDRNNVEICFGQIKSIPRTRKIPEQFEKIIRKPSNSFLKLYSWQMLLSIGYRFQQRLTEEFLRGMDAIEDEDEFYQTSVHLWRRASEYHFLRLAKELRNYQEKVETYENLSSSIKDFRTKEKEHGRWSVKRREDNYAYVPSVTVTPTTICVNPLKLVKTNRVLREKKFGGHFMFALVEIKDEDRKLTIFPHDYRSLRSKIEKILEFGFSIGLDDRIYRYLHHSQSQLKDKQFWFYHYDPQKNISFEEAFSWMGDFQSEKIVAKHAARIAQCFTSAEAMFPISLDKVEFINDVHTNDQRYNFTDGAGTMSTKIRDRINQHREFSAIQIRYAGCKGVISLNPDLDNSPHELRIRNSMNKFKTDHNILEICRVSKPRPLYLNRQIIVLLSHRMIEDRKFILLQNRHQKFLAESLVYPERAYELLNEKLNRSLFKLRELIHDAQLNLIQEPFFSQLLITLGKFELGQMRERTRLKLPRNSARNMLGVVDEYGILEYGQVFVQYTELINDYSKPTESANTFILQQKVVVTRNPCHHPGDIRVFTAVDVPQLHHLKDVIVFPQRGHRPHPNEISGSDLDGDEYAVIWHPDFVPETSNDTPYDYDCQKPLLRIVDRAVSRADIQATVLDISEQSCIGKLSSLHLAFADRFGVAHQETLSIAGFIADELDAPKTGQHPLKPHELQVLQSKLKNERPDYFDKPNYQMYPSPHILGQVFRSFCRFEANWSKIQTPSNETLRFPIDPLLVHDLHERYLTSARELARIYREQIMDIMYVYHFSSDIDLLCRFNSASPQHRNPLSKQQVESTCLIADSAQVEYKQLITLIRKLFYKDLSSPDEENNPKVRRSTVELEERKMAKASALYVFCYTDTTHSRRILSLPWLFAKLLIETRKINIQKQTKLLSPSLVSQMLEIQPFRLIGRSLRNGAQFLVEKEFFEFQYGFSSKKDEQIEVSLRPTSTAKRLIHRENISIVDFLVLEVLNKFMKNFLGEKASPVTEIRPVLVKSVWQHLITRFVSNKCSPLTIVAAESSKSNIFQYDWSKWSDERAWNSLQKFIELSEKCSNDCRDRNGFAQANEYLILALQQMATTGSIFS